MNISLRIAFRYLFSKKSRNAINIISIISASSICVGTMALVCVLSVYNGFELLIKDLFSEFDPSLKISLVEGKTFDVADSKFQLVKELDGVAVFSEVLQDNALIKSGEKQMPGILKGVESNYNKVSGIEKIIQAGQFKLKEDPYNYAVVGSGIASRLDMGVSNIRPVVIYAPKRTSRINLARPGNDFNQKYLYLSGVFSVQQAEYDDNFMIVPIELTRDMFEYGGSIVSSVELLVKPTHEVDEVKRSIQEILGVKYAIKDRYEQQESFFKIMKVEKWISYLILSFILLIAIFNVIGSLSMLIIEKKEDIQSYRNMGATRKQIQSIFLYEGWLISAMGAFVGIVIGVSLCLIQQHFGIITLHGGNESFIINAYPVHLKALDVFLIFVTVISMGALSVRYPVKFIKI